MSLYSDPFGDQDKAASDQQVPGVVKPPSANDVLASKDIDEGHGGINSSVSVAQVNDVVGTHVHDNSPFKFAWHGRF